MTPKEKEKKKEIEEFRKEIQRAGLDYDKFESEIIQSQKEEETEFIRLVKEKINEFWTNGLGECICPECWDKRESDEKRVEDCMFLRMFKENKFVKLKDGNNK